MGGNRIQSDRIHAEWLVSYISTLNRAEESSHRGHPVCPGVRLELLIPEAKVLIGKTPLMPFAPSPYPTELMCFLVGFSAVREFGFSRPIFADTKQTFLKHPLLPEESGFRDLLFVYVLQLTLFSGAPECSPNDFVLIFAPLRKQESHVSTLGICRQAQDTDCLRSPLSPGAVGGVSSPFIHCPEDL